MKKPFLLITILIFGLKLAAFSQVADSTLLKLLAQTPDTSVIIRPMVILSKDPDTLKQQLAATNDDMMRSAIYSLLAANYLKYDTIDDVKTRRSYQAQALTYSYKALHIYSYMHDTLRQRDIFDGLAKVYRSQKKYPQAKWFILQSNALSRAKHDIPNVMTSLIILANIKMDIKDYTLAMRDLDEALKLSINNHYPKVESRVQENYGILYARLQNFTKADAAIKRHDLIEDSLLKANEELITKAQDTLQVKKKVLPLSKKVYKTNSSKKIASI